MKNSLKKVAVFFLIFVVLMKNMVFASIFSDLFGIFENSKSTINNDNIEIEQVEKNLSLSERDKKINEEYYISQELFKKLDKNQKEIVEVVKKIYISLVNIDIDGVRKNVLFDISNNYIINLKGFFNDYKDVEDNCEKILKNINYEVLSFSNGGNKIYAKIKYSYPSVKSLINKTFTSIIAKNATDLFLGKIGNKNLASVIGIISKEIEKNGCEKEISEYDFEFQKIDGEWKLSGISEIEEQLREYVNEIAKTLLK